MVSTMETKTGRLYPAQSPSERDEWESCDEETPDMSLDKDDGPLIDTADSAFQHARKEQPLRLKSRRRQKAQNAEVGIKLVTDMSQFRKVTPQQQHRARFQDSAALRALEGSPNSASIGSLAWLKTTKPSGSRNTKPAKKAVRGTGSDLSPGSRPIVIGIAFPSDDVSSHEVSPQTAVVETPVDMRNYLKHSAQKRANGTAPAPQQLCSVWSPDTEASESPGPSRAASSVYSHYSHYGANPSTGNVPPVPALPATLKFKQTQPDAFPDTDDEDVGTPCTLFEEDGSPMNARKSFRGKPSTASPQSAETQTSGWWDYLKTPLNQRTPLSQNNPFRPQTQQTVASSSTSNVPQEWWQGVDEKREQTATPIEPSNTHIHPLLRPQQTASTAQPLNDPEMSMRGGSGPSSHPETHAEKARILIEENQAPAEQPPPYSPPATVNQVKYGVILPPSRRASPQPIPSPGPLSPGIPGTMSSQGAINMSEIPITPRIVPPAVLPDRPVGSLVTGDHFHEASGDRHRVERTRRRYEKEEVAARKVGGFWRGRGCVPANGCFGRTGREGRKRRRVCLGICGVVLAIIIIVSVVLGVLLTRKPAAQEQPQSIWLNLTDFPPMPTGVLTMTAPDRTRAVDGCLTNNAPTAWSCAVPKDEQDPKSPYAPESPQFIFQIQYDNNTHALWKNDGSEQEKIPNAGKEGSSRSSASAPTARAADMVRGGRVYDEGFEPTPGPPSIAETFFLGNTTDDIVAAKKEGEPTPFFISLLPSTDRPVGPDVLARRADIGSGIGDAPSPGASSALNISDFLPAPATLADGTGAPARLYPLATQQPLRLFDRGLPTEHYGFHTYFTKSVYLFDQRRATPSDRDGGARLADARFVVSFAQTRFFVKIWTGRTNTTQLIGRRGRRGDNYDAASAEAERPGTMPYPVTVAEDLHGGSHRTKATWVNRVDENGRPDAASAAVVIVDRGFGGTLINGLGKDGTDLARGGIDGGTGGCACEWVNWQGRNSVAA